MRCRNVLCTQEVYCTHLSLLSSPLRRATTPCLKNCAKLFLSELRQISTNSDNFWQDDGKEAKIMRGALILRLT